MISFADLSVADHRRSAQGRVHFINALAVAVEAPGVDTGRVVPGADPDCGRRGREAG
jgi:hypothetical protein